MKQPQKQLKQKQQLYLILLSVRGVCASFVSRINERVINVFHSVLTQRSYTMFVRSLHHLKNAARSFIEIIRARAHSMN